LEITMQAHDIVHVIKFLRTSAPYYKDDQAGFEPELAELYAKAGIAVIVARNVLRVSKQTLADQEVAEAELREKQGAGGLGSGDLEAIIAAATAQAVKAALRAYGIDENDRKARPPGKMALPAAG
jgi:hypothetical protein